MSLTTANIEYGGQAVDEIIVTQIASNTAIETIKPRFMSGFKGQIVRPYGEIDNPIQPYNVDGTTPNATATYDEQPRTMCAFEIHGLMNNQALFNTFQAKGLAKGMWNENSLTQTEFGRLIEAYILLQAKLGASQALITGNTDYYTSTDFGGCPGWIQAYAGYSGSNLVELDAAALEVSDPSAADNVFTELNTLYEGIGVDYRFNAMGVAGNGGEPGPIPTELVFVVNTRIYDALRRLYNNMAKTGNPNYFIETMIGTNGQSFLVVNGFRVIAVKDWPFANPMITPRNNLLIYTDSESDFGLLQIIDLSKMPGLLLKTEWRMVWRMRADIMDVRRAAMGQAS